MRKKLGPAPDVFQVGSATQMEGTAKLARAFGVKEEHIHEWLTRMKVPVLNVGQRAYFMVSALEEALFAVMRWGQPGFLGPRAARLKRYRQHSEKMTELAKGFLDKMDTKALNAQMDAVIKRMGRDRVVNKFMQGASAEASDEAVKYFQELKPEEASDGGAGNSAGPGGSDDGHIGPAEGSEYLADAGDGEVRSEPCVPAAVDADPFGLG